MITQGQKMRSMTLCPLPCHESEYVADIERIVTNLYLGPHHLTIVKFLRPVEFIMHLDALSIRHLYLFSSFRRWQGLHEKLQVVHNIAIWTHPTQGDAGIIFLTWRSFECGVVIIIVDLIAPLAEPSVKSG